MGIRAGGCDLVKMWIVVNCEQFGETPAWALYNAFSAWLVAEREMRQRLRVTHKLSKGEFGTALAALGFRKRLKAGRTYYLGIAPRLGEL